MVYNYYSTRAAPKVMSPTLLYLPIMSEVNISSIVVEVESFNQYSNKFCCHVMDSSRGIV